MEEIIFLPIIVLLLFAISSAVLAGYSLFFAWLICMGPLLFASVRLTAARRDVSFLKFAVLVLAAASVYFVFYRLAPYVAAVVSLALPAAAAAIAELHWTEKDRTMAQLLDSYRGWLIVWSVVFLAGLAVSFLVPEPGITREALSFLQSENGKGVRVLFPTVTGWKEPGNFWAGCAATASVCSAVVEYVNLARKAERERETTRLVERRAREVDLEAASNQRLESGVSLMESASGVRNAERKLKRVCKVQRKIVD